MSESSETYTLNSEEAAGLCRELLTTDTPPPTGGSLNLREKRPPSIIAISKTMPYRRRMWSPVEIRQWCARRQPLRIRKALACLERAEGMEIAVRNAIDDALDDGETRGAVMQLDTVLEILAAGDEP